MSYHRPPRFGKSLLLDMISTFFDISYKDNFDTLFSGLYAQKFKSDANSFHVLRLNFSFFAKLEDVEAKLNARLVENIEDFCSRYLLREKFKAWQSWGSSGLSLFKSLCNELNGEGKKIFVLVDEYERFVDHYFFQCLGVADF